MTIEKKIESVQEYNLLKLLKANSDLKRFGVEWIKLDHNLCRAFATNSYALIIAELEPNQWHDIFDGLPELVFITKLNVMKCITLKLKSLKNLTISQFSKLLVKSQTISLLCTLT